MLFMPGISDKAVSTPQWQITPRPNSIQKDTQLAPIENLLALLQELLCLNPIKILVERALRPTLKCPCCGGAIRIVKTRISALFAFGLLAPSG
jgi:hypothetical protein